VIEGGPVSTNLVTISDSTGDVGLAARAGNPMPASTFATLDGITFRCGPSGESGCP
jgi:hypothetical protein